MNIVPQFVPTAMPKGYSTIEKRYKMVDHYKLDDDGKPERDENGRKIKAMPSTMEAYDHVSNGGVLFTMPAGHSVRLTSPEQIKQFGVSTKPVLIDLDTGDEVDENGRPLKLIKFMNTAKMSFEDVSAALEVSSKE